MAYRIFTTCVVLASFVSTAFAQFTLQGPGVDPADFRVTTFAAGLNFPVGMAALDDGSILVATSNGTLFGSSSGDIVRLVDTDGDGQSDQSDTLVNNVPGGGLTSLRVAGDLVFTTGQGRGKPISIYRMAANPADPMSLVGSIEINYPSGGWLHPHSALQVRELDANTSELYFQLGSKVNFATTSATASLTSDVGLSGTLVGDAIHRVTITDNGTSVTASNLTQIATGLRNAAGMAFHPTTGDLYLEDNGIDGLSDANEPHSADELNVIPVGDIGGAVESFGFPDTYTAYRTDTVVGNTGIQPLAAFQPIDGAEAEGPNDIAFAPAAFPSGLNNGVFVSMHGKFSLGGIANEENPLVFVNLDDNSYFHFISNEEVAVGHLDGLISTNDSLFLADISPDGAFGNSAQNDGIIYQITSLATQIDGDFNGDGDYDCLDINQLTAEISAGTNGASLDLTGDGAVDVDDRDAWLAEAGAAELASGNAFLLGDQNLDGAVNSTDLGLLLNNFDATSGVFYCDGDLNGDSHVDSTDLGLLLNQFDQSALAAAVPEPNGAWILLLVSTIYICRRR